jgi:hypothetical protein
MQSLGQSLRKTRAIQIATRLIKSNVDAIELAERLMGCEYQDYRGLNLFVEDLAEFSNYYVIDGSYNVLMTQDTAEDSLTAWEAAKQWVRTYHAMDDEDKDTA